MTRPGELAFRALKALVTEEPLEQRLGVARMHLGGIDDPNRDELSEGDAQALTDALNDNLAREEQAANISRAIFHLISASGASEERKYAEMRKRGMLED